MSGPERSAAVEIDVRSMSVEERHDALARALDLLRTGRTIRLVTDRDPKPLLRTFEENRQGELLCVVSATTPGCFRTEMRVASAAAPSGALADALTADHGRLDRQLAEIEGLLQSGSFEAAMKACARFEAELGRHMRAEEELLFPALRHMNDAAARPVDRMLLEHGTVRTQLRQLGHAIEIQESTWPAQCQEFRRLLDHHHHDEEETVHPISDWALAADEQDELLCRLRGE